MFSKFLQHTGENRQLELLQEAWRVVIAPGPWVWPPRSPTCRSNAALIKHWLVTPSSSSRKPPSAFCHEPDPSRYLTVEGSRQCLSLHGWPLSLGRVASRFVHRAACFRSSFLSKAESHCIFWAGHIWFICSSVNRHLGGSLPSAAVTTGCGSPSETLLSVPLGVGLGPGRLGRR